MKYFLLKIGVVIFKILSCPFMLFPITNKITILSRMSNNKTLDICLLEKEIKENFNNYKVVIFTDRLEGNFKNKLKYMLKMPKYIFNIYTSKIVICDCYIPAVSLTLKKKKVKIIQMWHAMGAYKKFAFSCLDTYEGAPTKSAQILKMHNNYDYVIASSQYSKEKFSEAFNITKEKIIISLLPRCNYLIKNNSSFKNETIKEINFLNNGKKNILYAPTFRKSNRNYLKDVIKNIDYNKYNLIIKKHGGKELIYIDNKKIYEENKKYELKLLCVSDLVITDYSAITFDALLLNKPVYFYVPDYEKYIVERGIYEKIEGGKYYTDINELLKNIKFNKIINKQKYIDTKCDSMIVNIEKIIKGEF